MSKLFTESRIFSSVRQSYTNSDDIFSITNSIDKINIDKHSEIGQQDIHISTINPISIVQRGLYNYKLSHFILLFFSKFAFGSIYCLFEFCHKIDAIFKPGHFPV